MKTTIDFAETDTDILQCFPVMRQLVTLTSADAYLKRVRNKEKYGYKILCIKDSADHVIGVAGIRLYEYFAIGQFLVIDDFVICKAHHRQGLGTQLFAHIKAFAKEQKCSEIQLDSNIDWKDAHNFYRAQGMDMTHCHFTLVLW